MMRSITIQYHYKRSRSKEHCERNGISRTRMLWLTLTADDVTRSVLYCHVSWGHLSINILIWSSKRGGNCICWLITWLWRVHIAFYVEREPEKCCIEKGADSVNVWFRQIEGLDAHSTSRWVWESMTVLMLSSDAMFDCMWCLWMQRVLNQKLFDHITCSQTHHQNSTTTQSSTWLHYIFTETTALSIQHSSAFLVRSEWLWRLQNYVINPHAISTVHIIGDWWMEHWG